MLEHILPGWRSLGATPVKVPEGAQACAVSIRIGLQATREAEALIFF
ncbi:hypothetical protein [Thermoflexus sp.]